MHINRHSTIDNQQNVQPNQENTIIERKPKTQREVRLQKRGLGGYRINKKEDLTMDGDVESNPGPKDIEKILDCINDYLNKFCLYDLSEKVTEGKKSDLLTPFGFNPNFSQARNLTFDNTNYSQQYIRWRATKYAAQLLFTAQNYDTPIDGFSCIPTTMPGGLVNYNPTIPPLMSFFGTGGSGPAIVSGPISAQFEEVVLADAMKLINSMRSQTAAYQQTTNFLEWSQTRDVGKAEGDSNSSQVIGSNAYLMAHLWMWADLSNVSTEFCPLWNKLDTTYFLPRTSPIFNAMNYPPSFNAQSVQLAGGAAIDLNHWCCTQLQMVAYLYSGSTVTAAPATGFGSPIFIPVNQQIVQPINGVAAAHYINAFLPYYFIDFNTKVCETWNTNFSVVSPVISFLQAAWENRPFVTYLDAAIPPVQHRTYNVVYVFCDWNANIVNNGFDYGFSLTLGVGVQNVINTALNNPFANGGGGVPYQELSGRANDGSGLAGMLAQSYNGSTTYAVSQAGDWIAQTFMTEDEMRRAFVHYCHAKYRFTANAQGIASIMSDQNQRNMELACTDRPVIGVDNIRASNPTMNSFDYAMQFQDMFGAYIDGTNNNMYRFSKMSVKMQMAIAMRVRIPKDDFLEGARQMTPWMRAVHGLEFATLVRCISDVVWTDTRLSHDVLGGIVEGQPIGNNKYQILLQAYFASIQDSIGIPNYFDHRPQSVIDRPNPPLATSVDTYAVLEYVYDRSISLAPCYVKPDDNTNQNRVDRNEAIIKNSEMYQIDYTFTRGGIAGAIIQMLVKDTLDYEKFQKYYQPNPAMLGFYLNPQYVLDGNRRINIVNRNTKKAYNMYIPAGMPSAQSYSEILINHVNGVIEPAFVPSQLTLVDLPRYLPFAPDTMREKDALIAMSQSMVSLLTDPNAMIMVQLGTSAIPIQGFNSASIDINPSTFTNTLAKISMAKGSKKEDVNAQASKSALSVNDPRISADKTILGGSGADKVVDLSNPNG